MSNNYFTAAYIAQTMLKLWVEDDKRSQTASARLRQIVFINSAAAFLGVPGYTTYTRESTKLAALKQISVDSIISLQMRCAWTS